MYCRLQQIFQSPDNERTNKLLTEINDLNQTYNVNLERLVTYSNCFLGHMWDTLNRTTSHLLDSYLIYENNISPSLG